jgi:hypothetical protein
MKWYKKDERYSNKDNIWKEHIHTHQLQRFHSTSIEVPFESNTTTNFNTLREYFWHVNAQIK